MTDPCKFEPEIFKLISDMPRIERELKDKITENKDAVIAQHKETKASIDTLVDLLKGVNDTKPGLIHKVLSNSTSVSRLWKFSIAIGTALIGGSIKIIFFP